MKQLLIALLVSFLLLAACSSTKVTTYSRMTPETEELTLRNSAEVLSPEEGAE